MKFNINGNEVEVSDEDLSKALEDKQESFEVKLPDITMRTADEDATLKTNIENNIKSVGFEIGRKDVLKGLGIESEGAHKSTDGAIAAINTFAQGKIDAALVDAKIDPDKKVAELQKDKEALQATNTEWQTRVSQMEQAGVVKDQNQQKLNTFAKHVPENSINSVDHTVTIMNSMIKTGFNENGIMFGVGEDGEPIKDQNQNLLTMDKVIGNFFDKNTTLLSKANGGAGGSDSVGGGSKQTFDEFIEEQQKAGIRLNGPEFNKTMAERQKAGTLEE
jgi:hypothetical protein